MLDGLFRFMKKFSKHKHVFKDSLGRRWTEVPRGGYYGSEYAESVMFLSHSFNGQVECSWMECKICGVSKFCGKVI